MTGPGQREDLPDEPLEGLLDIVDQEVPEDAREASRANLRAYLAEVAGVAAVSPQEEADLARRAHAGDVTARDRIVEASLRRVLQVACRFVNRGIALSDLIEEGNLGLLQAAERYDPARDGAFPTFVVWWVRQAIVAALAERARERAESTSVDLLRERLVREGARLADSLERRPTAEELAAAVGVSAGQVEQLRALEADREPASEAGAGLEAMGGVFAERPDLTGVLDDLAGTERDLLGLRLGLATPAVPLEAAAERLGITPARARAVEASALRKVSALLQARGVRL